MRRYKFCENNSGGGWWLNERDYEALFAAGWKYEPKNEREKDRRPYLDHLDSKVPYGWRRHLTGEFDSIRAAVESFECATGKNFFEQGCNCCGAPFTIGSDDEGPYEYISGDSVDFVPVRPW